MSERTWTVCQAKIWPKGAVGWYACGSPIKNGKCLKFAHPASGSEPRRAEVDADELDQLREEVRQYREDLQAVSDALGRPDICQTPALVEAAKALRAIQQRATMVAGDEAPALSGDPSPRQAAVTARYILGGDK